MTAASVLVERCKNNDVSRFDLVYPILFNYRHGLEAAIKWVLDRYGRYTAIETYEKDHNLHKLWKVCRQVIEEVGGQGGDDEALDAVDKIVHEFTRSIPNRFRSVIRPKKTAGSCGFPILRSISNT